MLLLKQQVVMVARNEPMIAHLVKIGKKTTSRMETAWKPHGNRIETTWKPNGNRMEAW